MREVRGLLARLDLRLVMTQLTRAREMRVASVITIPDRSWTQPTRVREVREDFHTCVFSMEDAAYMGT